MRVSVIVSTYNSPEWLEKVLWGYAVQSYRDFELLIADDGSTAETRLLIERLRRKARLPIIHFWQPHCGFRKCTIMNRAIAASSCPYLLFSDGDCIPRWDFVATHVRLARPGYLLSGGSVKLPLALSREIAVGDVVFRRATDPRWLIEHGLPIGRHLLRLACGMRWGRVLDRLTPTRATFNGCNTSAWRDDVLRVNGFDERMEYGGLDRELGERLVNTGVRTRQIRHRAICLHLDHARGYVREEAVQQNLAIRRETRLQQVTWSPYGIGQPAAAARAG